MCEREQDQKEGREGDGEGDMYMSLVQDFVGLAGRAWMVEHHHALMCKHAGMCSYRRTKI